MTVTEETEEIIAAYTVHTITIAELDSVREYYQLADKENSYCR